MPKRVFSIVALPNAPVFSYRVEGLSKSVFQLFLLARAEQQRSAVDVCDETESLCQRPSPHALIVLHHHDDNRNEGGSRNRCGPSGWASVISRLVDMKA